MLYVVGVEEKTKFVEVLAVGARVDLELAQELPEVLLGQVFAPIFLLFSHLILLLPALNKYTMHISCSTRPAP